MDDTAEFMHKVDGMPATAAHLREARAAVSELIEAVDEVLASDALSADEIKAMVRLIHARERVGGAA